jgi:hypothetical protein
MSGQRWTQFFKFVAMILVGLWLAVNELSADLSATISGVVVGADGPIAGATVRVRATANATTSDSDGTFTLSGVAEGLPVTITAWYPGYYIAGVDVVPPASGVTLALRTYHTTDNPDYEWLSPDPAQGRDLNCGNCHVPILPQWENNAHAHAVSNPRFFSLYNGTDINGRPEVGPGFKRDFPALAGNCATCHAPAAAVDAPFTTDMNAVRDSVVSGIHCDFCHKIGGAYLNPATAAPYANSPGMLSLDLRRPPEGEQIFFGPYDDVPDPDTYLPLMTESQFCAACHSFSFWGTPIYQSYNEWLASPYAGPRGQTCQHCHMAPTGQTHFVLPERGGLEHPPETIPSHLQPGAADVELLQNTVDMTISTWQLIDKIETTVVITNTGAGHHVPTDHPGRHMILVITATDQLGRSLLPLGGSTVPKWGGAQAGLPGKAFAKVLQDVESGESPVVSYWKQTLIVSDNRIPALESDISRYTFALPQTGDQVHIAANLIFRRLFQPLAEAKGWNMPDILMAQISTDLQVRKETK